MTIIGLEIRKSGLMNLLVFDPMFKTPRPILSLIGSKTLTVVPSPRRLLKFFRRGDSYLKSHQSFELLKFVFHCYVRYQT
jgi:zinc finger-containing ubiquitin peptidase 1